jgi:alkaline phosphatase D
MTRILLLVFLLQVPCYLLCQKKLISGPMLGPVELRDARIWIEVSSQVRSAAIQYNKKGEKKVTTVTYKGELGRDFNPVKFTIGGLDFNTTYEYRVLVDGKLSGKSGIFTTKDLWQWRKPAPDFSFLAGSCYYLNEPLVDRPGKPYGLDSSIFKSMALEKSAFMLWLGDSWYTREVDYYSEWGLWNRASHDRAAPVLQDFLKAMPQFGTWDDHDYGPDNMGSNYVLKETSRDVFNNYFCNPSSGENGQGIYTMTTWGDADIFLTDNRWWRSDEDVKDSLNGQPNPEKKFLGKQQMEWLKNSLLFSKAIFKVVVVGSQALNPGSPYGKWRDFSFEFHDLMNFLKEYNINGVLFLTGDRHHSEIIRVEREGTYPLFDITVSPLTSGTHSFGPREKNNPYRVLGIDQKQNYGKFNLSGPRGDRKLSVEFFGVKGDKLAEWSVSEKELRTPVK